MLFVKLVVCELGVQLYYSIENHIEEVFSPERLGFLINPELSTSWKHERVCYVV